MITNNRPDSAANQSPRSQSRQPNTYYFHHDSSGPSKVTTTVIHALADVMDVDVSETEFSLFDSIDPDALDRLFRPKPDGTPRPAAHVAFGVKGYRVTVYSDGEIVITEPRADR